MKASEGFITRFLDGSGKKFVIPVYQRSYSWKEENCKQLWDDLVDVYENHYDSHFFGSVVYVEEDTGGENEYIIIDGQQRITTVCILLLAIRNYLLTNKISSKINTDKITNIYLTDQYAEGDKKLKLKLVEGDDAAYDRLVNNQPPEGNNNNVTINYLFFYANISNSPIEKIEGIYDAISRLDIVNVSLKPESGDNPQLIFESLNSTGQDLEESDKIRNFILMGLKEREQNRIYKTYWEKLETTVGKDETSNFIRYYLCTRIRDSVTNNQVYFQFKKYRKSHQSDPIEDILKKMLRYADFYKQIKECKISDSGFQAGVARLMYLDLNTTIPLLFDFFDARAEGLMDDDDIEKAVNLVEAYYLRRMVGTGSTASLNKTFISIGADTKKTMDENGSTYLDAFQYSLLSRTGKTRFPKDMEFVENFKRYEIYNAKSELRKYILSRLENFGSKERVAVEDQVEDGELTIEHIMPQTLTDEWKKELGADYEMVHSKYLHTIGNITLTAYNSDFSNFSFKKKKELKDKGFNYSKLSLNDYVKGVDEWKEPQIKERADLLAKKAEQIWPYPVTTITASKIENWVDLDDDYDFTGMTVSKVKICGDEIATKDLTDAYNKINVTLFFLDPETYSSWQDAYRNSDQSKLREPYSIAPSMFVEENLSSQKKVSIIKEIVGKLGLAEQDISFLVSNKKGQSAFDIEKPQTYETLKVGRLAYEFFKWLLLNDKLSDDEIERLKDKQYSRETFERVTYPVLALAQDANRIESKKYRYYKDPVDYNGINYFITSQWFDESREDLLKYFASHR